MLFFWDVCKGHQVMLIVLFITGSRDMELGSVTLKINNQHTHSM
jgi:hypothetical protein